MFTIATEANSPFDVYLTQKQLAQCYMIDPQCGFLFTKVAEALSRDNMDKVGGSHLFSSTKKFEQVKASAVEGIKEALTTEGRKHNLIVDDVWVEDNLASDDFNRQKEDKLKDKTFGVPVYAKVRLVNKKGDTLDEIKRIKLTDLPKMTNRGTFIVKGSEWTVPTQFRLKPGVYTVPQSTGLPKTQINMGKGGRGRRMEIHLDPEKQRVQLKVNNSHIPLYPVLRGFGMSHDTISKQWGEDLANANRAMYGDKVTANLRKFADKWLDQPGLNKNDAVAALNEQFNKTEVSAETTSQTLRKAYSQVNPELLLDASAKLSRVQSGEEEHDDRDHLRLKSVHDVSDIFKERFVVGKRQLQGKVRRQLDQKDNIRDILDRSQLRKMTEGIFTGLKISERSEQYNPMTLLNDGNKTTLMGEGALGSLEMVKDEARSLHPSHLAFLDSIKTPESAKIGVVNFLTTGAKKVGNELVAPFIDAKSGASVRLTPGQMHDKKVAFPDQYDVEKRRFIGKDVKVQYQGQVTMVPAKEVDLIIPNAGNMFTYATARIPFLDSMSGGRAFMASKHAEQALPLVDPDLPMVKASIGKTTVEDEVGKEFAATAPVAGQVTKVEKDHMIVKPSNGGKGVRVNLYDNFKLNEKSFLHHTPKVKVGDKVKSGQVLADTNFTKDGQLAMGRTTKVAYMPMSGHSIEDGIIVSESYSKRMEHEEMIELIAPKGESFIYDKQRFASMYPGALTADQAKKLDSNGVVKIGQVVHYGDPVAAVLRLQADVSEDRIFRQLGRGLTRPMKNSSVLWTKSAPGTVINIGETNKAIKIQVKLKKKLQVADKLAGSFGNKGVVSKVLPDHQMPKDKDGNAVDMVFNPLGIVNRINPGQLLEAKLGKVAGKEGSQMVVENFRPESNWQMTMDAMKKAGVEDTQELFDEKGKSLGEISTGDAYFFKLSKTADTGFSARSFGEGYDLNGQPLTGGDAGSKSVDQLTNWGLVAHGSKDLLREIATSKSERNDEYWRAAQMGQQLPAPKPTFAWRKFDELLKTSGVNMKKNGSLLLATPMMDDDIAAMSAGEITDAKMLRGKGLQEHKGGLFDQELTGGLKGQKATHIRLAEPIPNPIFRDPVKKLTGINDKQFNAIVQGKEYVSKKGEILGTWDQIQSMSAAELKDKTGIERKAYTRQSGKDEKEKILSALFEPDNEWVNTGGIGMRDLLSNVSLSERKRHFENIAKNRKGSERNSANRALRYIKGLDKMSLKPQDAYMQQNVYVPPPVMRPVYQLESGDLGVSPLNYLFRDLTMVSNQLKENHEMDDDLKADLRASMYQGMEALTGVSGATPLTRPAKGALHLIAGDNPKTGLFQRTLIRKQQDLAGRGVAVPNPNLGIDEVGLPREMALKLYRPFVTAKLVKQYGLSASDAVKRLNADTGQDQLIAKALGEAMGERPAIINRAPSLHKYSVQAFKPVISAGREIETNTLIHAGFNLDHDGDALNVHIPVSDGAVRDANNMMPSNILRSPARIGDAAVGNYMPFHMTQQGIYNLSKGGGKNQKRKAYTSVQAVKEAIDKGEISAKDTVTYSGKAVVAGRVLINDILPQDMRNYDTVWDKKAMKRMANELSMRDKKKAAHVLSRLQKLGDEFSSTETMTMQDIKPVDTKKRKSIINKMKEVSTNKKLSRAEKSEILIGMVEDQLIPEVERDARQRQISFFDWIDGGASGGKGFGAAMQHISGPTIVTDFKKEAIPVPVENSYSEGLSASDYFNAGYGARGGMIGRALATAQPGYRNKLLLAASGDITINGNDCGDTEGIKLPVSDPNAVDRFEVKTHIKVTPQVIGQRKKDGDQFIHVRSPVTCKNSHGVCRMCYGPNEDGELYEDGVAIGAIAGQSIGEPLTQCFHRHSLITVKIDGRIKTTTIERLFCILSDRIVESDFDEAPVVKEAYVWDFDRWTLIKGVSAHKPTHAMRAVGFKRGIVIAQGNHPTMAREYKPFCKNCGSRKYRKRNVRSRPWECTECGFKLGRGSKEFSEFEYEVEFDDMKKGAYGSHISIPSSEKEYKSWINPWLLGFYLAEGSASRSGSRNKKHEGYKYISIAQKDGEQKDKAVSILESMGLYVYQRDSGITVRSDRLYDFASHLGRGSENKTLPVDFMCWENNHARDVLCGFIDGDGCIKQTDSYSYVEMTTVSFGLAQGLAMLCRKLGYKYSIKMDNVKAGLRYPFRVSIYPSFHQAMEMNESIKVSKSLVEFDTKEDFEFEDLESVTQNLPYRDSGELVYDLTTATGTLNVGMIRTHNSAMSSFHSGGAIFKRQGQRGRVSGFKRIQQLTGMPHDLPEKSPIAVKAGKVERIEKTPGGGQIITVEGKAHSVLPGLKPVVRVGDFVKKGTPLTDGLVDPRDVLEVKGLRSAQKFLTNELHNAYGDPSLKKKNFEVMVRAITNTGIVEDPGENAAFSIGDTVPLSFANDINANPVKEVRIEEAIGFPLAENTGTLKAGHVLKPEDMIKLVGVKKVRIRREKLKVRPELFGVSQVPHTKSDWIAALGQEQLRGTIQEAAATGAMSDIHGYSPTTAFAYGAEFGRGEDGRF